MVAGRRERAGYGGGGGGSGSGSGSGVFDVAVKARRQRRAEEIKAARTDGSTSVVSFNAPWAAKIRSRK